MFIATLIRSGTCCPVRQHAHPVQRDPPASPRPLAVSPILALIAHAAAAGGPSRSPMAAGAQHPSRPAAPLEQQQFRTSILSS